MKKTGILVLVLVLAMGSLGVGYAAWSDLLTVNNTAQLGSLDARFTNAVFEDHDNASGNDFGTVAVNSGITGNPDVATMTISNAYPGYTATGTFTITNFSTMAVKIDVDEEGIDPNNRFTGAPTTFTNVLPGESRTFVVTFALPTSFTLTNVSYAITYELHVTQQNIS
jgi:hypothetical protein